MPGILDHRLPHRSADAVPHNWNMTTPDTARIETRKTEFRLALEAHPTRGSEKLESRRS